MPSVVIASVLMLAMTMGLMVTVASTMRNMAAEWAEYIDGMGPPEPMPPLDSPSPPESTGGTHPTCVVLRGTWYCPVLASNVTASRSVGTVGP